MNTEDAKLILASTHEGAAPDSDAEEAFALLDSDPSLREWFEQEQAFDHAISSKLSEIEPPADLKATLISLLNDNQIAPESLPAKNVSWFRPQFLAAAAAVILVSWVAIQMLTGSAEAKSFDSFRHDMVDFAHGKFELDLKDRELPKLYKWLNAKNATCPTNIPACIGTKESIGCKIIDWNEESVTLICLLTATDEVVHCFVLPLNDFESLPDEKLIRSTLKLDDLETCGWTDQDNLYLLVGSTKGVKVAAPPQ